MTYEWLRPEIIFGSILYAVIGIVVLGIFFVIVDKLTPYHLWTEIVDKKNIALAHLPMEFTAPGTEISVEIRNQPVKAVVVPTPFYKRQKK